MSARLSLTAIFEPVENGWTQGRIAELPGVITAAPTPDEAREMLADAVREYLLALQTPVTDEPSGAPRARLDIVIDAA